jgi:hypothetical protein
MCPLDPLLHEETFEGVGVSLEVVVLYLASAPLIFYNHKKKKILINIDVLVSFMYIN